MTGLAPSEVGPAVPPVTATGGARPVRICIVYHSRRGTMHRLAGLAAVTARTAGMSVRLRRVPDHPAASVAGECGDLFAVSPVSHDDLRWADGLVLGTPTYYGNVSWEFKRFVEWTSPLWHEGVLIDRVVTGFTSSNCTHGGQEATLLSLYQSVYHWGSLVAPSGLFPAYGEANPHGVSRRVAGDSDPDDLLVVRAAVARLGALAALLRDAADGRHGAERPAKVLVVHDAASDTEFLTRSVADGVRSGGAEVRLCQVGCAARTLRRHLAEADAVAFGCRAELGAVSGALQHALLGLTEPRGNRVLDGKPVTGFVCAPATHAGSETALLSLYRAMHHLGAVIMPNGRDVPAVVAAGGNPYGTSWVPGGAVPPAAVCRAAEQQGRRLADVALLLRAFRHIGHNGRSLGK